MFEVNERMSVIYLKMTLLLKNIKEIYSYHSCVPPVNQYLYRK